MTSAIVKIRRPVSGRPFIGKLVDGRIGPNAPVRTIAKGKEFAVKSRSVLGMCLMLTLALLSDIGTQAFAKEAYKVGATYSITGPAAFIGEAHRNAAKMVEEMVNANGGIDGHPLELVVYDNESSATKTVMTAEKLIQKDKVLAVIGPSTSGCALAIIPVLTDAKTPLVVQAASRKITAPADKRKWVFKVVPGDDLCVELIYRFMKARGIKKVAILSVFTGYGISGREALRFLAPKFGIEIVADKTYTHKDTDLTSHLTEVCAKKPDAIINWSVGPTQIAVVKNWKQLGSKIPLYMSFAFGSTRNLKIAGEAAEGLIVPVTRNCVAEQLAPEDPQAEVVMKFETLYEEKFKKEAGTFGGQSWDALNQVVDALKAVGPDRAKIRDYLENIKNWPGQNGVFNRSPKDHIGLAWDCYVMVEVRDGKWKLLKE